MLSSSLLYIHSQKVKSTFLSTLKLILYINYKKLAHALSLILKTKNTAESYANERTESLPTVYIINKFCPLLLPFSLV